MTNNCRSKNPATCPYHGANGLLEREQNLFNLIRSAKFGDKTEEIVNEYFSVRKEREAYEDLGGDEIALNNGIVTNFGNVSPTIKTIASKIAPVLVKEISLFHFKGYAGDRIKDVAGEQILNTALTQVGYTTDYVAHSHKIGPDIFLTGIPSTAGYDNYAISVKSGEVGVQNKVSLSGSRSTGHESIEEKIAFFKRTSPDIYMCLSGVRIPKKANPGNRLKYKLSLFSKDLIDFGKEEDWLETKSGWTKQNLTGPVTGMSINTKMSGQLWFTLDLSNQDFVASTVDFNVRAKQLKN